mgnify:CR=1 FL=1
MAARERYTIDLFCNNCKNCGKAKCSEDDHVYMSSIRFRVDSVEGKFRYDKVGNYGAKFFCLLCGNCVN